MYTGLHVTGLRPGDVSIRVPSHVLGALSLRPRDSLHAVLIPHGAGVDRATIASGVTPFATVYASPLPFRSWDRLFRAAFFTGPGPGTAAALNRRLEELDLYPRLIATAESWVPQPGIDGSSIFAPDTNAVLEYPRPDVGAGIADKNRTLHEALRAMALGADTPGTCLELLRRGFSRSGDTAGPGSRIRVDWVSPMRAVNRLAALAGAHGSDAHTLQVEEHEGSRSRGIPCLPWRTAIWPQLRDAVEESRTGSGEPVVVVTSVDTEERVLTAHLYRLQNMLITSFDVVVPAAGMEQRWWRWIYEEIGGAAGTVIGSATSARRDARWGTLTVVAAFRAERSARPDKTTGDIGQVVSCFRRLKGQSAVTLGAPSDAFNELRRDIGLDDEAGGHCLRARVTRNCLPARDAQQQLDQLPRLDSTLQNVRLWYWHQSATSDQYEKRFGRNPYRFTGPMNARQYADLHPDLATAKRPVLTSRLRLAERLLRHLTGPRAENVVLVGAYRSGKTTLMNIVVDLLNGADAHLPALEGTAQTLGHVLAVRVSAALTPPEELFATVFREICHMATADDVGGQQRAWASAMMLAGKRMLDSVPDDLKLEVELAVPLISKLTLTVDPDARRNPRQPLDAGLPGGTGLPGPRPKPDRAAYLRTSVRLLKSLMRDARVEGTIPSTVDVDPSLANRAARVVRHQRLRIVVALDEVTESAAWEGHWAFPAWRQLIEDPDFNDVRWLFSSTGPLSSSVNYSPLGNALREYNMEPLDDAEVADMIRAFEVDGPWDSDVTQSLRLRPTVTYNASRLTSHLTGRQPYLLQVVCCHLFESAMRDEVPIVTSRIVKKVVRRSVLPELSDYFDGQWKKLTGAKGENVATAEALLQAMRDYGTDPWSTDGGHAGGGTGFASETQKAVERAGLGGLKIETRLVPLFVIWMKEHFEGAGVTGKTGL